MSRFRAMFCVLMMALTGPAAAGPPVAAWESTLNRDHPLVGRIWSRPTADFMTPDALVANLAAARHILLGEIHDNPDHHRLQAWLVTRITETGRAPALVMEMIAADQAPALAAHLETGTVAGLDTALNWAETGWPDWAFYRPIIAAALAAGAPIVAGNPSAALTRAVGAGGVAALGTNRRAALALDAPLDETMQAALIAEIGAGHCDLLPESALGPMAGVQRLRDATMARAMAEAGTDGAILIAGAGHVRAARGAPHYLRKLDPEGAIATLAFVEVKASRLDAAMVADSVDADAIWFTPRTERPDMCARMRAYREGSG